MVNQSESLKEKWNPEAIININRQQSFLVQKSMEERFGQKYIDYRYNWEHAGSIIGNEKKALSFEAPLNLDLEITSYCNLCCKMCLRATMPPSERINMSMEMVDRIIAEVSHMDIPAVMIGGGSECTLHPHLKEILKKVSTIPSLVDTIVITNGIKLTPDIVETLIDLQVTKLFISLDAATPETYQKIRGGSLTTVEANIQHFLQRKKERNSKFPMLRVSFVEQPDNIEEKSSFFVKWKNDAQIIDFQKLMDFKNLPVLPSQAKEHFCRDVYRRLSILSDGTVTACCVGYPVGSIVEESILDCWNSEKRKSIIDTFYSGTPLDRCKRCEMLQGVE